MNLSKSRYTQGITCPKKLWLSCYKPEEAIETDKSVFENGNKVGDLARNLFGEHILIEYNDNKQIMLDETKKYIKESPNIICEASFNYDGNFCSIDILKNDSDGVEIYEVKSSTDIEKIYLDDISYQTWVLKKCGLNVKKCYLVYVNNKYVFNKKLDIHKYFKIEDVTSDLDENVETKVKKIKKVIDIDVEPNIDISNNCHKPYECPFFNYCIRSLPKPNIFDIGWHTKFSKKLVMYEKGLYSFEDVLDVEQLNDKAYNQVNSYINNLKPIINKEKIKEFLTTFKYPLYFLDFESYQPAIPNIDGIIPYQKICFQYSLHILDKNNNLTHKEYLSKDYDGNPMYELCKQLCEDIPKDSCVIVYNETFEKERLKEMAKLLPEFSEHLLNIRDNIVDLAKIFINQYYYTKDMGSGYSIKKVLPALYPNDPELDYHNLNQVHKGDEASNAYLSLKDLDKYEEEKLRHSLLKYCGLDTYAMVKIYEKLKEVEK